MTTICEAEAEYCRIRCGDNLCGYQVSEGKTGKPCDLLIEFLKDVVGAD